MSLTPKDRWSKDVANYDLPHHRLRTIARLINDLKPHSLVDLGCAKGTLRNFIDSGIYAGCDFIEPQGTNDFRFIRCDFNREKLPNEIKGVEMIVASGLLEYIDDLPAFLSQLNDLLSEKGSFIATYFNMNHFSRLWKTKMGMQVRIHPDWKGMHSLSELKTMLTENGFRIKTIVPLSHSISASKPASGTLDEEVKIDSFHFYSALFAHQFIFVCEKAGKHQ
jgi:SAM-dependent methyltransferase